MKKRYEIVVYARRNNQPCYSYVQYDIVKASKVVDTIDDVAYDIMKHETRSGLSAYVLPRSRGAIVTVIGPDTFLKFIVRAWPVRKG